MENVSQPISQAAQADSTDIAVGDIAPPSIAHPTPPQTYRVMLMRGGNAMRFPSLNACWRHLLDEGNANPSLL